MDLEEEILNTKALNHAYVILFSITSIVPFTQTQQPFLWSSIVDVLPLPYSYYSLPLSITYSKVFHILHLNELFLAVKVKIMCLKIKKKCGSNCRLC